MTISSFIFGGNTGETPDTLARRRELRDQLAAQIMGHAPTTSLGGIGALLSGAAIGLGRYRDNKAQVEGQKNATSLFSSLLNGANTTTPASTDSSNTLQSTQTDAKAPAADISGSQSDFIKALLPAAMEESKRTGVDPRIIVAQAAQESAWGKRAPGNNFFGIKSHDQPGGQLLATHEVINGKRVPVNDRFRTFDDPASSVRGYGDFILQNPRYSKFRTAQGLDAQLAALQASGYATDPNYSNAVGSIARNIQLPQQTDDAQSTMAAMMADPRGQQTQPIQVADNSGQIPAQQTQQTTQQNSALPGVDPRLIQAMANPWISADQKAVIQTIIKQQLDQAASQREEQTWKQHQDYTTKQAQSDPVYQQNLQKGNIELESLRHPKQARSLTADEKKALGLPLDGVYQQDVDGSIKPVREPDKATSEWAKLDDGSLFNQRTGEVKRLATDPSQKFRFPGNSPEAAALNGLIESGQLTEQQAQQIAAGKSITGPNGELLFATPQALMGGQNQNQTPTSADDGGVNLFPSQPNNTNDGGVNLFPNGAQPVNPVNQTPVLQNQSDATVPRKDGMIQLTEPRVTDSQKNAMTFADRMTQSNAILDDMGMKGTDTYDQIANDWLPFGTANYVTSDDFKKVDQAKRDFVNAQLRRESGAAISPSEFDNAYRQYFPQPNDPEDTIKQKADARRAVLNGMIRDAGPTYKPPKIETKADRTDAKAPDGVDPDLWKHMTPEERKLWQH